MTTRIGIGLLLLLILLSGRASADEAREKQLAATAGSFIALLDSGKAADAWQQLTPLAQTIKSDSHWQRLQQALRSAYGPLEKRTLRGVTLQNRYVMLPDGNYAIVQFDTVFRNKRTAVETVVLALGADDNWRVHDYIIN